MSSHFSEANEGVCHAQIATLHQQITTLQHSVSAYEKDLADLRAYCDTLTHEKERFRIIADFTYDWEYWIDPDGTMLYVSPSCERITGYRPSEFLADPALLEQIVHPDDYDRVRCHLSAERHSGQAYEIEFRIITRTGSMRWIGHACQPVYNEAGHWLGQRASNRDITEQKQLQEAYHVLVEESLQGLILFQAEHVAFANPAAARITGYTSAELLAMSRDAYVAMIHPDDRALVIGIEQNRIAGMDAPSRYELRIMHKDGSIRWLEMYATRSIYQGNPAIQLAYIDITERKQAEDALRDSQRLVQHITNTIPDLVYVYDLVEDRNVYANGGFLTLLGYNPVAVCARGKAMISALLHPDDTALIEEQKQRLPLLADGDYVTFEVRMQHQNGDWVWLSFRETIFMRNLDGTPRQVLGVAQNITRRKQAEIALQQSEQRFRTLFQFAPLGMVLTNMQGYCDVINPAFQQMVGYTEAELAAMRFRDLTHPDDILAEAALINTMLADKRGEYHIEKRYIRKDGQIIWVHLHAAAFEVMLPDSKLAIVIVEDITERKRSQEALRNSEQRYRDMFEKNRAIKLVIDPETGAVVNANPAASEFYGYTLSELRSMNIAQINILPTGQIQEEMQHALAEERLQFYFKHRLASGMIRDVEVYSGPIEIAGKPLLFSIVQDVTERYQAEEALRTSKMRLQAIFDNAAVGIALVSIDNCWLKVNQRGQEMLGYTSAELIGQPVLNTTYPADWDISQEHLQALLHGQNQGYRLEKRFLRKDGSVFWGDLAVKGIYDPQGSIEMVVGILTDITERKEAEVQLYQVNHRLIRERDHLRQRNQEMLLLNQMGDMLQTCQSISEAYGMVGEIAGQLFAGKSGALYIYHAERDIIKVVSRWGERMLPEPAFAPEVCKAFQQNCVYTFYKGSDRAMCQHVPISAIVWTLCVPLVAQNETLGILSLCGDVMLDHATRARMQQLAETVASHVAMALSNLELRERLREQAIHDSLTGLFNRRYLDETLTRELKRADRQDQPVGLILLDIDHFKHFNDTYGHDTGDTLLRLVGAFLKNFTRGEDIACRYGGEEFIVVLPGATLDATCQRAEELRLGIGDLSIRYHDQVLAGITVSLGVAVFPEHGMSDETLVKVADMALYRAKGQGRNCVVVGEFQKQYTEVVPGV